MIVEAIFKTFVDVDLDTKRRAVYNTFIDAELGTK
jgi:hypothetical protein